MAIDPVLAFSGSGAARTVAPVSAVQAVACDPWQAFVDGNQPPMGNDLSQLLAALQETPAGRELLAQAYPELASQSPPAEKPETGFWAWLTDMFSGGESPNLQQAESVVSPQAAWRGVPNAVGSLSGANEAVSNQALLMSQQAFNVLGATQKA